MVSEYLTYAEYKSLGGKVPEDVFPIWERRARRKLDYLTFDRIPLLDEVPTVVKETMVDFIEKMYAHDVASGSFSSASSYSNGIESITYKENASSEFNNELVKMATESLPDYLTARSVNFDVREYLQSKSNNPQ
jgi:hypothetical protein